MTKEIRLKTGTLKGIWIVIVSLLSSFVFLQCKKTEHPKTSSSINTSDTITFFQEKAIEPISTTLVKNYDTLTWSEITTLDNTSPIADIKYATSDNFIGEAVYPCGRCFLKKDAAAAILKIQQSARKAGYNLVLFDCYRPRPIQQLLWNKVPNINYVANPEKGSMHNRGITVDIGLADINRNLIDMGTDFDEFSRKSFTFHPFEDDDTIYTERRKTLRRLMEKEGFRGIKTEWWHFTYIPSLGEPLEDWQWKCNEATNN